MRACKAVVWIVSLTGMLLLLAAGVWQYHLLLLAGQWQETLQTVPDHEVIALLDRVAGSGPLGLRRVVDAMGSERSSVGRAARQVLEDCVERWKASAGGNGGRQLVELSESLSDAFAALGSEARYAAADLASRILQTPLESFPAADRQRLLSACDRVLRAERDTPVANSAPNPPSNGLLALSPPPLPSGPGPWIGLPGGALPVDVSSPPLAPSGKMETASLADERSDQPPQLLSSPQSEPLPTRVSSTPVAVSKPAPVVETPERLGEQQRLGRGEVRRLSLAEARSLLDRPSRGAAPSELAHVEVLDLMRQWLEGEPLTAAKAGAELRRRGFNPVHFELIRRLFDPRPEARRELAQSLPGLQGVDAAPWLQLLAYDEDPEVRLTAITLMATAGTPEMLAEAIRIAGQDSDPTIQRQAERLGPPRR